MSTMEISLPFVQGWQVLGHLARRRNFRRVQCEHRVERLRWVAALIKRFLRLFEDRTFRLTAIALALFVAAGLVVSSVAYLTTMKDSGVTTAAFLLAMALLAILAWVVYLFFALGCIWLVRRMKRS
jgi:hypothetical protein